MTAGRRIPTAAAPGGGEARWLRSLARQEALRLGAAISLGIAAAVAAVVTAGALARALSRAHLEGAGLAQLEPVIVVGLAAVVARAALSWLSDRTAAVASARIRERLRARLLAHLAAVGPALAGREQAGELAAVAVEGVDALDEYLARALPQVALAAAVPPVVAVAALSRDPLGALILVGTAPLIPLFTWLLGRWAAVEAGRRWRSLGRLGAAALDLIQGLDALVLLGRSRTPVDRVRELTRQLRRETIAVLRVAFLSGAALELIATLSTALVAVAVGLRLLSGRLELEAGLLVLLLAPEFFLPLRRAGAAFHAGATATAAAGRIRHLLAVPAPHAAATPPDASMPERPTIRLQGVTVRWPGRTPGDPPVTALDALDLELAPGETVALVGPSGAGKSTVAAVLLRLVEPAAGRLLADRLPAPRIGPDDWRGAFAWVPQSPVLLEGTLAANLRVARPAASDDDLVAACSAAGLDGVLAELPDGLDTPVGERAVRLSGGEARRVALARALLADAPVVVLDEAAEGLDPDAADALDRTVAALAGRRTVLVIAHRLATARGADRVVMLDRGRVVAAGRHDELVSGGGPYAALVAAGGGG